MWAVPGGTQPTITPVNKLRVGNGEISNLVLAQNTTICTKVFESPTSSFFLNLILLVAFERQRTMSDSLVVTKLCDVDRGKGGSVQRRKLVIST